MRLPSLAALVLAGLVPAAEAAIDAQHLGARYDANVQNITFRVYSSRATRLEVWIYASPLGAAERVRYVMTKDPTTNVWSKTCSVATLQTTYGITGTVYYGYRAWGPNWTFDPSWTKGSSVGFVADVDASGNRFDPNKLLLDPYAREVSHDPLTPGQTDGSLYTSGPVHRAIDTGAWAPKGIVLASDAVSTGTKPTRALKDDVVYEVHLRGLTENDPGIPAAYRGTYKGAGLKAAALAALGVTVVELLPVQEAQNDTNDVDPTSDAGDNYWGYATLGYFAPERRYASDKSPGGPTREWKAMVKAFHDAGLKVWIDVVYNHTGEGGAWTADTSTYSLLSWRGLDNPTYYSLTADLQRSWDNTGVGGNFNTYNSVAQNLIVDSLAYWRNTLGVDGFRYDLASVLGNTCQHGCFRYDKTDPAAAVNRIVAELPARPAAGGAGTDHIAEPWAIGSGTYQVGQFPAGWAEWNDKFRDALRRSQNKLGIENVTTGELATRFAGSSDLYGDDGRRPASSVNFVVAHDGFTLKDLYSCNIKNNTQPWPYGPSDGGSDNNLSWDQGGDAAAQRRAARNGMALLLLSAGTPMMTGGDEWLRSLRCNNNPYNLDSIANWLGAASGADQTNFNAFVRGLIAFRRAHAALRPRTFYSAADTNGNAMEQLRWFTPAGQTPDAAYWNDPGNHALAWRIDGSELADTASALYVAYNGWSGDVSFTLPWPGTAKSWYRVTDTSTWAEGPSQVADPGTEAFIGGEGIAYVLHGRGLLLLIAQP
jgi:glycogen operon protein